MNWFGGIAGGLDGDLDPSRRPRPAVEEKRRAIRSGVLATATFACHGCDAPIAPVIQPMLLTDRITCPYCRVEAPARDFLSFVAPTRPARVVVRVAIDRLPQA